MSCKKIDELFPSDHLSNKDLNDYWVTKFESSFSNNFDLLPKWARAYHNKYHSKQDSSDSSSESDVESDKDKEIENENAETASESDNFTDEDMDPDLRATRVRKEFYQNPDSPFCLHCSVVLFH